MSDKDNTENTQYETDNSEISESELLNEKIVNEIKQEKKKNKNKMIQCKMIKSSDPNIEVEIKKHTKKPKKKIIIYKEDIESSEDEVEVIYKNRKKGRPKSNKIIKYKNDKNEIVEDKLDADKLEIDLSHTKELNAKEIKLLKLQEKLTELETISGKKIRATRKGEVDKRQTTKRTQKQIEATERLVLSNKMKREAKLKEKTKETVEQTIKELSSKAKEVHQQKQEPVQQVNQKIYNCLLDPDL